MADRQDVPGEPKVTYHGRGIMDKTTFIELARECGKDVGKISRLRRSLDAVAAIGGLDLPLEVNRKVHECIRRDTARHISRLVLNAYELAGDDDCMVAVASALSQAVR